MTRIITAISVLIILASGNLPNEKVESTCLTSFKTEISIQEYEWVDLIDSSLSYWDVFMGVPHTSVESIGNHPRSENVHEGKPLGLNNDPKDVFTMINIGDEDVIHVSGEIYGGLTSKEEYENYHLSLEYKWGSKKWEPRLNQKRDAGLLYHCTGDHGAFWNVWMRCLEFQIQEGDTGDFIALAGANAWSKSHPSEDNLNYQFNTEGKWLGVGESFGNWLCARKANFENEHGEWNQIEIYCHGNKAIHIVNGHIVNAVKDAYIKEDEQNIPLIKGRFQLQSEAAEIFYKAFKIRPIDSIPASLLKKVTLL